MDIVDQIKDLLSAQGNVNKSIKRVTYYDWQYDELPDMSSDVAVVHIVYTDGSEKWETLQTFFLQLFLCISWRGNHMLKIKASLTTA